MILVTMTATALRTIVAILVGWRGQKAGLGTS